MNTRTGQLSGSTAVIAALLGALALTACGSDDSGPVKLMDDATNPVPAIIDPVSADPGTVPSSTPPLTLTASDISTGGQTADAPAMQYPVDSDGDDLPGMIITGLDGTAAEDLASPWLVHTGMFRNALQPDYPGDGYVDLVRYREDFPLSAHADFFANALDTCLIRPDEPIAGGNGDDDRPPPRISGGETVVINTPSGPWNSYERRAVDGEYIYPVDDGLPGALPVGATLSIPGDTFPTVADYPLFEPDPVQRLLPDPAFYVDTDSRYSWVSGDASTHVKMDFLAYDEAGDFQNFAITCWVTDDGAFTLPADALQAVASSAYFLDIRYARVYSRLDYLNGIVFYQAMTVAE